MATNQPIQNSEIARSRVAVDLSPSVSLLLDHISEITGSTKAQIVNSALVDALPALIDRSDVFSKRVQSLLQSHNSNIKKHR